MDEPPEDHPVATQLEVRETYDRIAAHFSETRAHPWPQITDFLDGQTGDTGLDLGCGNGRHLGPLAECCSRVIGLDISQRLLRIAAERTGALEASPSWLQGDASRLPVRNDTIEVGLYIAALHHLPSQAARRTSLNELARVLAPDGMALVSVWSTAHDRFDAATGFDTTVDWTLPDGETVPRYYHIYDSTEFGADLTASALRVEERFTERGNCFAVVHGEGKRT